MGNNRKKNIQLFLTLKRCTSFRKSFDSRQQCSLPSKSDIIFIPKTKGKSGFPVLYLFIYCVRYLIKWKNLFFLEANSFFRSGLYLKRVLGTWKATFSFGKLVPFEKMKENFHVYSSSVSKNWQVRVLEMNKDTKKNPTTTKKHYSLKVKINRLGEKKKTSFSCLYTLLIDYKQYINKTKLHIPCITIRT